jgi:hypothetical protein
MEDCFTISHSAVSVALRSWIVFRSMLATVTVFRNKKRFVASLLFRDKSTQRAIPPTHFFRGANSYNFARCPTTLIIMLGMLAALA